jgi:hypothetical protein
MTLYQTIIACIITGILIFIVYKHVGFKAIKDCYAMWFTRKYWINYNIVEALSWGTKAIIIVPGLIFGIQIWWLYFLTLCTSLTLIWASNKKLLPTLVAFNSLWVWISVMVLVKSLV